MSEVLTAAGATVTIARRHQRRDGTLAPRTVPALDSSGTVYSYRKGPAVRSHVLAWKVTDAELSDLLAFVRTSAKGVRVPVTWTDSDAVERTIRFTGGESWRQLGPDLFLVEIPAEEVAA